jgi:mutator protein MutT
MPLKQGSSPGDLLREIYNTLSGAFPVEPEDPPVSVPVDELIHEIVPIAAGIMYTSGDRVLLLKRAQGSNYAGTWAFPGGKIDDGETPEQAARRESSEEISHDPGQLMLIKEAQFSVYGSEGDQFPILLNSEHDGYVWATADDLPMPLHPGVQEYIDLWVSNKSKVSMDEVDNIETFAMDKGDSARQIDGNGWIEIKGNPLSKVGIFQYRGRQISTDLDPDKLYNVYRPAEELSSEECINSFKLLPWIDNHVMLGSEDLDLTPAEKKGVQGVIGEDVYFSDGVLYGNIKVFSETLANLIDAGKRELSCGYRCSYEYNPGSFNGQDYEFVQRNMWGNHLALVNSGRMGSDVAVLDNSYALDQMCFSLDSKEPLMAGEVNEGSGASLDPEILSALEQVKSLLPVIKILQDYAASKSDAAGEPAVTPAEDPAEEEVKDAAVAEIAPEGKPDAVPPAEEKKEVTGMDEAVVQKLVQSALASRQRRDDLAKKLSVHVGAFDCSAMDESAVQVYGIKKLGLKAAKGQEGAVLQGYLQAVKDPRQSVIAQDAADKRENFVTRHLNKGA